VYIDTSCNEESQGLTNESTDQTIELAMQVSYNVKSLFQINLVHVYVNKLTSYWRLKCQE